MFVFFKGGTLFPKKIGKSRAAECTDFARLFAYFS
jgi:hypothetical protein